MQISRVVTDLPFRQTAVIFYKISRSGTWNCSDVVYEKLQIGFS